MGNAVHWLQEFGFTPQQAEEWSRDLPKGKTLTRWCLETNKLQVAPFLMWAKKHYQLPTLTTKFTDFKSAQEIAKRYGSIWPDHVVPFYEWDGVLFLACLEPVTSFQAPQKHQWVLAPLQLILQLRGEEANLLEAPTLNESLGPAGLNLGAPLDLAPAGLARSEPTTPAIEAPAGLSIDFGSLTVSGDAPSGISEKTKIVEPLAGMPSIPNLPPPPVFAQHAPPPIPPKAPTVGGHEGFAQTLLDDLSKHFDRSMILFFQGETLQPWKWSSGWKIDNNRDKVIDLSSPSVFRIVVESKHAFHGSVVPNSINDSFFQTWNNGTNPEHLTVVPIPVGNSLAGMILGVCTKSRAASLNLKQVEQLGIHAAERILQLGPLKAA